SIAAADRRSREAAHRRFDAATGRRRHRNLEGAAFVGEHTGRLSALAVDDAHERARQRLTRLIDYDATSGIRCEHGRSTKESKDGEETADDCLPRRAEQAHRILPASHAPK